jgi:enoyl-CoA hydratase/carnithine racemase
MTDPNVVLCDIQDGIATLTLNRPERRNALSPELMHELLGRLQEVKDDDNVRVVVLAGAGDRAWCAGGDLGSTQSADGLLALHSARELFVDLLEGMNRLGKPIIAKVHAAVRGGGIGVMLACDLVVASDSASFGTPEIRVGLFPMMIMTLIFRNIGRKKAMEMMLTGDSLSAERAVSWGLVNRAVPHAELDAAVDELAQQIGGFSPAVLKLGRDAVYQTMDMPLGDALQYLRSQLTINTMLEDAAEGVMAFMTKRSPEWKGR